MPEKNTKTIKVPLDIALLHNLKHSSPCDYWLAKPLFYENALIIPSSLYTALSKYLLKIDWKITKTYITNRFLGTRKTSACCWSQL